MIKRLLTLFCLALSIVSFSQSWLKDSILFDPHLSFSYAYQLPSGDMADRFGNNSNLGLGFHIKTRQNWYYGIQGTFLFGNKVIREKGFLENLMVENGVVLDNDGSPALLVIQQRGFTVTANGGKLFPIIGPNVNSGLLIFGGAGILQHKIRIEHQDSRIKQLEGEYLKGYDRLTNGPVFNAFAGYFHMSNNRLINFYIGMDLWLGYTQSRRDFNFDTMVADTQKRNDNLFGIRAGWTLHLYKRMADDYYP